MLRKIWKAWKGFGLLLGNFIARVILTIFYFTVFVPFAIITRLFTDFLNIKSKSVTSWHNRRSVISTLDSVQRQV
ncbi:hypothetical protein BJP34_29245 [Moorena producens PAL-8-15-08-1]|uniref:Uncharacterized protein n=2 Tax=Moorena producens TaxID=1155739 RepID=A0A1D8TZJ4_9CYAN|nr:hypothetical protein BJP34_29245 [Moorena producens PAL-8-15-08-1]